MQKSLALLVVSAVLIAGLFAALWFTLQRDAATQASEATRSEASATEPDGTLAEPRAQGVELAGAALVSGDRASAQDRASSVDVVDPSTARHIAGRVVFPAGMERDDTLTVIAIGHEWEIDASDALDGAPARAPARVGLMPLELDQVGRQQLPRDVADARAESLAEVFSRGSAAVGADGRFELQVAERCQGAHLYLDGKHLFLRASVGVALGDPGAAAVVLEPLLGARILGRASVPARPAEEAELVGSEVLLMISSPDDDESFSFMRFTGAGGRELEIADDLAFEFRGLDPRAQHVLTCSPEAFLPVVRTQLELRAGQDLEVVLEHDLGARVSGRVVDGAGAPVEGAQLSRASQNAFGFGMPGEQRKLAQSDADGAFVLRGLRPGKTVVQAERTGYVTSKGDERTLVEGEALDGVVLVLESGLAVRGRVTWADGTPAAKASIQLVARATDGSQPWSRGRTFSERCDDDGRFAISGLADEAFDLVASAVLGGAEDAQEAERHAEAMQRMESARGGVDAALAAHLRNTIDQRKGPRWTARALDLRPGGAELVLVLEEPLSIAGSVEDDTGAPLDAFTVEAEPVRDARALAPGADVEGTFSEARGQFELGGLQPGRWRITARADGHAASDEPRELDLPYAGEPLVLVLPRAAHVAGVVLDPSGAPVAGASVDVGDGTVMAFGRRMGMQQSRRATTEADGRFELDLPATESSLTASADGWARSEPLPLELVPAAELENLVLQLTLGGTLTGEVYRPDGKPQAGAKVMANSMGGGSNANGRADDTGRFTIEHLTPGAYQIIVEPEIDTMAAMMGGDEGNFGKVLEALKMASAQIVEGETTHVVLGAPPKAPVLVVGRVTDGGEPVAGRMVVAMAEGQAMMSSMKMAHTDDDGRFELELRQAGPVMFTLQLESSNSGPQWFEDVPEVERYEVELALASGRLGGTVVGPDGRALARVGVRLGRDGGEAFTMMSFNNRVTSDADGRFSFTNLEAGEYSLRAGGNNAFGGEATYGTALVAGIRLGDGERRENVTIRLDAACEIRGRVVDSEGRPAAGAAVFVRDDEGRLVDSFTASQTDAGGRFTYRGIAPGDYTVSARGTSEACADGARITVRSGEASQVELALEPATMVLVTLESAEGVASRARVRVLDDEGREYAAMTTPAAMEAAFTQGFSTREHRIGPVPPGSYTVIATTFDGVEKKKPITLRGQAERRVTLDLE